MEAIAKVRYARMSAQKARLVADMVRGKKVTTALNILHFTNKATARILEKVIKSAKANAENKNVDDPDEMMVKTIFVDRGPTMRRQLSRARGRVTPIHKPFSHVTVVLKEVEKPKKKAKAESKAAAKPAGKKAKSSTPKAKQAKPATQKAEAEEKKAKPVTKEAKPKTEAKITKPTAAKAKKTTTKKKES